MRFLVWIFACFYAVTAQAVTTTVAFEAKGGTLTINGGKWDADNKNFLGGIDCTGGEVKDGKLSGKFECDLTQFKTGIKTRDEHMQTWLKAKEYPKAILELPPVAVAGKTSVKGQLTLMGLTRAIDVIFDGDGKKGEARMKILLKDFKPELPWYEEISVRNDVNVTAALDLAK